jgi:uncharacterized protein (TIGR03118 family)
VISISDETISQMTHMKKTTLNPISKWIRLTASASLLMVALVACRKEDPPAPSLPGDYKEVKLVANKAVYGAGRIDTLLKDAWGIAFSAGGTPWISSRGGAVSPVYTAEGAQARPAVFISSGNSQFGGSPTGQVFNGSSDFVLPNNLPARFIFVGTDGLLTAWNSGNFTWVMQINTATAAYTGLAIGSSAGANYLYAANFKSGKIDVWNKMFQPVNMSFTDPGLPSGYHAFNIQAIADKLYVAYAKVGANGQDEAGAGNGFVSIFNTDGSFVKRFASKGKLNSPWGLAMAPTNFVEADKSMGGTVPNAILVGNFGDGKISAFSPAGDYLGQLKSGGKLLEIDGLWAISFPPATATTVDQNRLYYAAGPNKGQDGLFGYIVKNNPAQ